MWQWVTGKTFLVKEVLFQDGVSTEEIKNNKLSLLLLDKTRDRGSEKSKRSSNIRNSGGTVPSKIQNKNCELLIFPLRNERVGHLNIQIPVNFITRRSKHKVQSYRTSEVTEDTNQVVSTNHSKTLHFLTHSLLGDWNTRGGPSLISVLNLDTGKQVCGYWNDSTDMKSCTSWTKRSRRTVFPPSV